MTKNHTQRTFACGVFPEGKHHRARLKGVLVEQDSEVRVASVRKGTDQRCAEYDHWLLVE